ncbi:serine/threonine-protein kinase [Nocardia blacklockiae]|uniref:serine/threonine-protein kinase n=1 Tax=Nocardia blacklockiae TaxID=480036 RepID=UPI002B4AF8D6|nr:protein kinase [Nocardia blacklockiae]
MDAPRSRAGDRFGPYELRSLLGRGGMGEVYEAYDSTQDRVVALKLLSEALAEDPAYRARFRRQTEATAKLSEPHVIPIHNWGEINGVLYIDMRLVRGDNLRTLLRRHSPMDPDRAVNLVEQVAAALDAAHRAGVVHRDVKPANILVTAADFAYLADFGISRSEGDSSVTLVGTAAGTYTYMAPERFDVGPVTGRADIYSLACVLHECLTGNAPFPAKNVSALIRAHLSDPPPRPSLQRSDVPPALDAVIAHAMAKAPEDRYSTAGEFAGAARAAFGLSAGYGPSPADSGAIAAAYAGADMFADNTDQPDEYDEAGRYSTGSHEFDAATAAFDDSDRTPVESETYESRPPANSDAYKSFPATDSGAYESYAPTESGAFKSAPPESDAYESFPPPDSGAFESIATSDSDAYQASPPADFSARGRFLVGPDPGASAEGTGAAGVAHAARPGPFSLDRTPAEPTTVLRADTLAPGDAGAAHPEQVPKAPGANTFQPFGPEGPTIPARFPPRGPVATPGDEAAPATPAENTPAGQPTTVMRTGTGAAGALPDRSARTGPAAADAGSARNRPGTPQDDPTTAPRGTSFEDEQLPAARGYSTTGSLRIIAPPDPDRDRDTSGDLPVIRPTDPTQVRPDDFRFAPLPPARESDAPRDRAPVGDDYAEPASGYPLDEDYQRGYDEPRAYADYAENAYAPAGYDDPDYDQRDGYAQQNHTGDYDRPDDEYGSPAAYGDAHESPRAYGDAHDSPRAYGDAHESPRTYSDEYESPRAYGDEYESPRAYNEYESPRAYDDENESPRPYGDEYKSPRAYNDEYEPSRAYGDEYEEYDYAFGGHQDYDRRTAAPGDGRERNGKRSYVLPAVLGVLAVVLVFGVAAVGWRIVSKPGDTAPSAASDTSEPNVAAPQPSTSATPTTTSATTTTAAVPAGATECQSGTAATGKYSKSATGSSVTSCAFAEAVREAYAQQAAGGSAAPSSVVAVSPVTGRSYTMNCTTSGRIVTCTGGENAVVYVY